MKKLIKEITSVFGPSGDEEKIRKYIKKQINNYVDNVYEDNLGNLIAVKKGKSNGKKIMFAAHMDQIALMITHIDEDGFLRFTNVGGVGHNFLPGTPIVFADGTIGTIGVEKLENINDLEMSKLYIDIGANNQQEAEKIVGIGDTAIYAPNFSENNKVLNFISWIKDRITDHEGFYLLSISDSAVDKKFIEKVKGEFDEVID